MFGFSRFGADLLDAVSPTSCITCGKRTYGGFACSKCFPIGRVPGGCRCIRCFSSVTQGESHCGICMLTNPIIRRERFLWTLTPKRNAFLCAIKERSAVAAALWLTEEGCRTVPDLFQGNMGWNLIVPIPPHREHYRKRGFHTCALFAEKLSRRLRSRPLHRSEYAALSFRGKIPSQRSLPAEARLRNMNGAFCAREEILRSKQVLLVEDVITTGATVSEAAHTLLQAGAASVDVVAWCRSEARTAYRRRLRY